MIGGGGHMIEGFTSGPRMLSELARSHPETPLAVLPASFYFPNEPFDALLPPDRAPVTLFCRERMSARHLRDDHQLPAYCDIRLDNDFAFQLADSDLVKVARSGSQDHILIVERSDAEHPDIKLDMQKAKTLNNRIAGILPEFVRATLRPAVMHMRGRRQSRFRLASEDILEKNHPGLVGLPRLVRDVSRPEFGKFEDFCASIADAAAVFTTRLHVAVLAGMAGKPTYLFEGGYWKARGVHEYSMGDMSNVQFLDLDEME